MNDSVQISSTGETEFEDPLHVWVSWDTETVMKYVRDKAWEKSHHPLLGSLYFCGGKGTSVASSSRKNN